jgi:hypothetical protein
LPSIGVSKIDPDKPMTGFDDLEKDDDEDDDE